MLAKYKMSAPHCAESTRRVSGLGRATRQEHTQIRVQPSRSGRLCRGQQAAE